MKSIKSKTEIANSAKQEMNTQGTLVTNLNEEETQTIVDRVPKAIFKLASLDLRCYIRYFKNILSETEKT